jgi:hypothetical protein
LKKEERRGRKNERTKKKKTKQGETKQTNTNKKNSTPSMTHFQHHFRSPLTYVGLWYDPWYESFFSIENSDDQISEEEGLFFVGDHKERGNASSLIQRLICPVDRGKACFKGN